MTYILFFCCWSCRYGVAIFGILSLILSYYNVQWDWIYLLCSLQIFDFYYMVCVFDAKHDNDLWRKVKCLNPCIWDWIKNASTVHVYNYVILYLVVKWHCKANHMLILFFMGIFLGWLIDLTTVLVLCKFCFKGICNWFYVQIGHEYHGENYMVACGFLRIKFLCLWTGKCCDDCN